jgi:hypothetical protein
VEKMFQQVKRPGSEAFFAWLAGTDFMGAPASTKYHMHCDHGLVAHSYNVLANFQRLLTQFPEKIPADFTAESVIITALFHDLCKVDKYVSAKKWKKVQKGGKEEWQSYPGYEVVEPFPAGHGAKSVLCILRNGMALTDQEILCMTHHMGPYNLDGYEEQQTYHEAVKKYPTILLLHTADEIATHFDDEAMVIPDPV